MSTTLLIVQTLNGLQLGVLLFLIAAGLTLVFGVMDFINLAHGVQYMLGAYLAVMFYAYTGNFLFALILALGASLVFGLLLEFAVFRHLYDRDHLDQVIATFGIILFLNQGVKLAWGAAPLSLPMPEMFSGSVVLMPGILYPVWRLVIIGSGLAVALGLLAALRLSGLDTRAVEETLRPEPVRVDRDRAWAALARDKKAVGGAPRLVLLEAPGRPRIGVELPASDVRAALDALIAG